MKKFAKLFDTPHGQFLATLGSQADDDMWPMTFRGEHEQCIPEVTNMYETEEDRQAEFDSLDQAKAEKAAEQINAMVGGLFKESQS